MGVGCIWLLECVEIGCFMSFHTSFSFAFTFSVSPSFRRQLHISVGSSNVDMRYSRVFFIVICTWAYCAQFGVLGALDVEKMLDTECWTWKERLKKIIWRIRNCDN